MMKCPYCGQPTQWEGNPARPFCSERCKLLDFGHWANEEYAVPAEEETPSFDEGEPQPFGAEDAPPRSHS